MRGAVSRQMLNAFKMERRACKSLKTRDFLPDQFFKEQNQDSANAEDDGAGRPAGPKQAGNTLCRGDNVCPPGESYDDGQAAKSFQQGAAFSLGRGFSGLINRPIFIALT